MPARLDGTSQMRNAGSCRSNRQRKVRCRSVKNIMVCSHCDEGDTSPDSRSTNIFFSSAMTKSLYMIGSIGYWSNKYPDCQSLCMTSWPLHLGVPTAFKFVKIWRSWKGRGAYEFDEAPAR
jgi:hypothetical protein